MEECSNPLNPSGVVALVKTGMQSKKNVTSISFQGLWQFQLTGAPLKEDFIRFYADQVGMANPVLRGIPLLRAEHGVLASKLNAAS
jgi:hypothetical protein